MVDINAQDFIDWLDTHQHTISYWTKINGDYIKSDVTVNTSDEAKRLFVRYLETTGRVPVGSIDLGGD